MHQHMHTQLRRRGSTHLLVVAIVALLIVAGVLLAPHARSLVRGAGDGDPQATGPVAAVEASATVTTDPTPEHRSATTQSNETSPPAVAGAATAALAPAALAQEDITLTPTDDAPMMTQAQAMQAIADIGVPWALGGVWDGKPVTVQAGYGLATFGRRGPGGVWGGVRNLPLPSGEVLDHIEQRPMWIIDYGNTVAVAGGCPVCPPSPDYDHTVYAVDAETGAVWGAWAYVGE